MDGLSLFKQGVDLITSDQFESSSWRSDDVRYFRCHLNEYNQVSTIVCLTREVLQIIQMTNIIN